MAQPDHDALLEIIAQQGQAPLELPSGATALLVIDMQCYFVEPLGRFARLADALAPAAAEAYRARVAGAVVPNVKRLLDSFREGQMPIFFTGTGTRTADGGDLAGWLRRFNEMSRATLGMPVWPQVQEADWQIEPEVAPLGGEILLQKTTADPFVSTDLDRLLKERGIRTVVVTGLTTDVCVSATARGAADHDYQVIVVEDACTTLSEQLHCASLEIIGLAFGRTARTADIVRQLPGVSRQTEELERTR